MKSEIFHFLKRDHTSMVAIPTLLHLGYIRFREGPKCLDLHFPSTHRSLRIYHNCDERLLVFLVELLGAHVDAGEPAPVARVGVVPPADVLGSRHSLAEVLMLAHVLVSLISRIDSRLRPHHRQRKRIHHKERISFYFALHEAHDFDVAARPSVHNHLDQRARRNLHPLEVMWIFEPGLLLHEAVNFGFREVVEFFFNDLVL
mmetsp:Transcript_35972/g.26717  ORF Transcript_35972/g.26717 Transcript_35972/m.26717 type:complete len:202 (-) Transcript_35972:92-697(-)